MSSLTKNYLYNIVSLLTGTLFPFITFPYISRILMPEYLGKLTFVQSISNYFITLALLGIPVYGIRELSRINYSKEKFIKTLVELFIISFLASIVSFILFIGMILLNEELNDIKILLYIYSIQVIFSFLNLDYFFIVLEKHKRRTIRTIVLRLISLGLILSLIKSPKDYIIYAMILIFPELFIRIIDIYLYKDYFYIDLKDLDLKKHLKPLFIIFLYVFSVGIYTNLDITMLGFMGSELEVGLYAVGSKLVKMIVPIISILGTVMAPRIIQYIKNKNKGNVYFIMNQFIDFNIMIGLPLMLLMIFLSKDIVVLVSGTQFIDSNIVMKMISIMIIILPIGSFLGGQVLLPNNKEKLIFKIAVLGTIINIILNIILIPKFGIEGAAFASIFTEILICFYRGYEVKRIYSGYRFITRERINYIVLGILAFIFIYSLKNLKTENVLYNIIIFTAIYGFIYLIGLILLKDKNIKIFLHKLNKKLF